MVAGGPVAGGMGYSQGQCCRAAGVWRADGTAAVRKSGRGIQTSGARLVFGRPAIPPGIVGPGEHRSRGQPLRGAVQEAAESKAERLVVAGLKRLGWNEAMLKQR